jgi:K+-transporting ATPase ATPase C chain
MRNALRGLLAVVVLGVLTGFVYPLVITGVAQVTMGDRADGSLVRAGDSVVGSSSIGQMWRGKQWFHGRPSAVNYDASASSGSNLGPTSRGLADLVEERVGDILELEGPYVPDLTAADIPADLVTASASGLDPHISVASAKLQAPRIAEVRGVALDQVMRLIDEHTSGATLGFLGQERVNVLELNLALAEIAPLGSSEAG